MKTKDVLIYDNFSTDNVLIKNIPQNVKRKEIIYLASKLMNSRNEYPKLYKSVEYVVNPHIYDNFEEYKEEKCYHKDAEFSEFIKVTADYNAVV